jgi:heterodisulfide reductase subunit B
MGLAFGLSEKDLKLNLNLAMTKPLKEKLGI